MIAGMDAKVTRAPRKSIRSLIAASSAPQKPLPTGCVRSFSATTERTEADALDLLTDAMVATIDRVPIDGELWSVEECAAHLRIEPDALQRLRNRAGFPVARLLSKTPLWLASAVIAWGKDHPRPATKHAA